MKPTQPFLLRVPAHAAERFRIQQLIARQVAGPWSHGYRLVESFALSSREERFARALLRKRSNFWLFRCNQRLFCGDFVVLDMSAPRDRRVIALELKLGEPLRLHVGGIQFARLPEALAEIDPVRGDGPILTALGDGEAALAWL